MLLTEPVGDDAVALAADGVVDGVVDVADVADAGYVVVTEAAAVGVGDTAGEAVGAAVGDLDGVGVGVGCRVAWRSACW